MMAQKTLTLTSMIALAFSTIAFAQSHSERPPRDPERTRHEAIEESREARAATREALERIQRGARRDGPGHDVRRAIQVAQSEGVHPTLERRQFDASVGTDSARALELREAEPLGPLSSEAFDRPLSSEAIVNLMRFVGNARRHESRAQDRQPGRPRGAVLRISSDQETPAFLDRPESIGAIIFGSPHWRNQPELVQRLTLNETADVEQTVRNIFGEESAQNLHFALQYVESNSHYIALRAIAKRLSEEASNNASALDVRNAAQLLSDTYLSISILGGEMPILETSLTLENISDADLVQIADCIRAGTQNGGNAESYLNAMAERLSQRQGITQEEGMAKTCQLLRQPGLAAAPVLLNLCTAKGHIL